MTGFCIFPITLSPSSKKMPRQALIKKMEDELNKQLAQRQTSLDEKIAEMEKNQVSIEDINQQRGNFADEELKLRDELSAGIEQLKDIHVKELLAENQFNDMKQKYGDVFEAGMGAEAILRITKGINLDQMRNDLIQETFSASGQRRKKASKQLQVV